MVDWFTIPMLTGLTLAAGIGLTLGLMGGGGSILTVPVFVYVLGFPAKTAIAMSLPMVGVTSLVGAFAHWRADRVHLRTAGIFGVFAMAGSYAGARLAVFIPGALQLLLLAATMLAAAMLMLRPMTLSVPNTSVGSGGGQSALGRMLPAAFAVGLLTGIVGIGGGFLIVPALVLLARAPIKQAVGTSLLVIAMNAAAGSLGYLGTLIIPWGFLVVFTAVAVAGILVGTSLVRFVPADALKRSFAVFLLLVGGFVLYQNRAAIAGDMATRDSKPSNGSFEPPRDQ